eukprot:6213787-Pleurochrysis_carterae.AAC.1
MFLNFSALRGRPACAVVGDSQFARLWVSGRRGCEGAARVASEEATRRGQVRPDAAPEGFTRRARSGVIDYRSHVVCAEGRSVGFGSRDVGRRRGWVNTVVTGDGRRMLCTPGSRGRPWRAQRGNDTG